MKIAIWLLGISVALSNLGCNALSFIDSPSGDQQILAAARACFDKGNFDCASKFYGQLSNASSDNANSEGAFEILSQNGVSVAVFMSAVISGSSSGGKLVTTLANSLTSNASETTRLNIFHAYQKNSLINDTKVRGLIRFITALSLMAEILAEDAGTDGKLNQSDIATNATGCLAASPLFTLSPHCAKPSGKKLISGTALNLATATDAQMSGSPSLQMIYAAVTEVNQGISQMQATGSLGSSTSSFSTNLLAATLDTGDSPGFRGALIFYDIGDK